MPEGLLYIRYIRERNSYELSKGLLDKLIDLQKYSNKRLSDVRIMPQLHKMAGIK